MKITNFRRLILPFVVLALALPSLYAQGFRGGIIAGINMSQLDGDRLAGYHQIGLSAGLRASALLSDRWQLSLELLYSQSGSDRSRNDDPFSIYDNIRLNFVETPVFISFTDWKFKVYTGGTYGRLINYKVIDVVGQDITDNQNYNPDIFCFILGVNFFFTENFGMDIRWAKGLNSLQADQGDGKIIARQVSIRGVYLF